MPESKRRKPKNTRPTPPSHVQPTREDPSPTWYVATMAGLMAVGVILVLIRFIFSLDQLFLVAGLALIAVGFLMTTRYR